MDNEGCRENAAECSKKATGRQDVHCDQEPRLAKIDTNIARVEKSVHDVMTAVQKIKTTLGVNGDDTIPHELTVVGQLQDLRKSQTQYDKAEIGRAAVDNYINQLPARVSRWVKLLIAVLGLLTAAGVSFTVGRHTISTEDEKKLMQTLQAMDVRLSELGAPPAAVPAPRAPRQHKETQ